jgi:hypothetical protein
MLPIHRTLTLTLTLVTAALLAACDPGADPAEFRGEPEQTGPDTFPGTGTDTESEGDLSAGDGAEDTINDSSMTGTTTETDGQPIGGFWTGNDISKDPNMCQQYVNTFGAIELDFDTGVVSGGNCINNGTFVVKGDCPSLNMMTIEVDAPECGIDRWACDVMSDQMVCMGTIKASSDGRLLYRRVELQKAY